MTKQFKLILILITAALATGDTCAQTENRLEFYGGDATGRVHQPFISKQAVSWYSSTNVELGFQHGLSDKWSVGASAFLLEQSFDMFSYGFDYSSRTMDNAYGLSLHSTYKIYTFGRLNTSVVAGISAWEENWKEQDVDRCFAPLAPEPYVNRIRATGVHLALREDLKINDRFDLSLMVSAVPFYYERYFEARNLEGRLTKDSYTDLDLGRMVCTTIGMAVKWPKHKPLDQ